jgi:hypothetical protein
MNAYYLMSILYLSLAVAATFGSALISADLLPYFGGLRWLRVHFITLGTLTQLLFGALPALVAARAGRRQPGTRWDIWLALNAGLIALLISIPLVNSVLMVAGGTLVFVATLLLIRQLAVVGAGASGMDATRTRTTPAGRRFYIVGLAYLLLGVFLGTGMWLGWGGWLRLAAPKEVHVHSNLWGFAALVFAGLLVDLYPALARRALAWPRSIGAIFWMMAIGALGLAVGPWVNSPAVEAAGLTLHTAGLVWLLLGAIWPLGRDRLAWTPGMLHLITSYVWLLMAVVMAPLIVFTPLSAVAGRIAGQGGPLLVYGWLLQFVYPLLPYLLRRSFEPGAQARLGGTWLSLSAIHLGSLLYLGSLLFESLAGPLQAIAYSLWGISMLPIAAEAWRVVSRGVAALEQGQAPAVSQTEVAAR